MSHSGSRPTRYEGPAGRVRSDPCDRTISGGTAPPTMGSSMPTRPPPLSGLPEDGPTSLKGCYQDRAQPPGCDTANAPAFSKRRHAAGVTGLDPADALVAGQNQTVIIEMAYGIRSCRPDEVCRSHGQIFGWQSKTPSGPFPEVMAGPSRPDPGPWVLPVSAWAHAAWR